MTATTKHLPLRKIRSHTTTVELQFGTRRESDAGWATDEGHFVHRVHDQWGTPEYWVRDRTGRYSMQDSLARAREAIDWLRERNR